MTSLYLRTTDKDGKAYNGFQWPMEVGAIVTAPDWNPTAKCGHGLHGLLDGLGEASNLSFAADAVWWIVEADDAIDLDQKHKFKSCKVVAFGPRHKVTERLHALRPGPIHGLFITAGYCGQATAGYRGQATVGDCGVLIFLRCFDGLRRVLTARVGEGGILPNVAYRASDDFKTVVKA
jgi:hypothetical protein